MVEQHPAENLQQEREPRQQRAGFVAFLVGTVGTLGFFAFWPGLPHVIDWGAILVAIAAGGLARWACQSWMAKTTQKKSKRL